MKIRKNAIQDAAKHRSPGYVDDIYSAIDYQDDLFVYISAENYILLKNKYTKQDGPGTELKKLISWFYVPDDNSCKCNDRIAKMNKWGPDGCEERMDTIVRWLKHSAATHNVPFQETVVRMLIKRAISNARKAV